MKKIVYGLSAVIFALVLSCQTTGKLKKDTYAFLKPPINYDTKKDVMIIFTGSDWDEFSQKANEQLFTPEFFAAYAPQFDIYNVDVVRNAGAIDKKTLEENYKYFSEYEVTGLPYLVLETNGGSVYAADSFETDCESLERFDAFLQSKMNRRELIVDLEKKVRETKGAEHTLAIDTFLKNQKLQGSSRYISLVFEAFESDPENKSGLKKKYLLSTTEIKAAQYMSRNDARAAADAFLNIADDALFTDKERQSVYYTAAYFLASREENTDEVLTLLNKALALKPNSELAPQIKSAIKSVSQRLEP